MIFDAHTHIHFPAYNKDRNEVIKRAQAAGVKMITVGTNFKTSQGAIAIAEKYPDDIWATVGCHPNDLENFNVEEFRHLANHKKVIAIGECGLDYYRLNNLSTSDVDRIKEKQKHVFLEQVKLANELNKPLMIHCRPSKGANDAYEDLIKIYDQSNFKVPATNHFFVGSLNVAQKFLDRDFYLTFGGAITFARDYDEVIRFYPLERILLETDAPYVAPVPYRGQRNEPAYVMEVAKKLAEIKNLSLNKVIKQTTKNIFKSFSVSGY